MSVELRLCVFKLSILYLNITLNRYDTTFIFQVRILKDDALATGRAHLQ